MQFLADLAAKNKTLDHVKMYIPIIMKPSKEYSQDKSIYRA